ncbi:MAG: J domain-containing protein [Chitinophagaceae bacterium]|nr:MAG: J domain-containing protein [Chitinophagaceae bacterium]
MTFFNSCNTIEEVKQLYKQLAKQHHPDRGGNTATMQAINTEYAFACAKLAQKAGLNTEEAEREIMLSEEYRQVIEQIIQLPEILIELVGNWIWVTGNTKPVKEQLSNAGFHFAGQKKAWYYRHEMFKTRGRSHSLNAIRAKYGSDTIHTKTNKTIEQN